MIAPALSSTALLGRRSSAGTIAVAAMALVVGLASSLAALPGPGRPLWEIPSSEATLALYAVATCSLALCAVVLAFEPPASTTLSPTTAVLVLTLSWAALVVFGRTDTTPALRVLSTAAAALAPAALLHLAGALTRWRSRAATVLVAIGYAACGVPALVRALVVDPFRDPFCRVACEAEALAPFELTELPAALAIVLLGASASVAAAALVTAVVGLARESGPRLAVAAVIAPALVELVLTFTPTARPGLGPLPDYGESVFVARCVSTTTLALVLICDAAARARRMARVRRGLERATDPRHPETFQDLLADALRDRELRVVYWLPSLERWADATGRAAPAPPGEAVTIAREGEPIAAVLAGRPARSHALEAVVGSAARLIIDNERLRVELLAQSRELQASRLRVVEGADSARRRLERDLHDGAQQRLLAASYSYRLASSEASDPAVVAEAQRRLAIVLDILHALRETARGVYPPVLADAGLVSALEALARSEARRSFTLDARPSPFPRLDTAIELTAYLIAREAITSPGASPVAADLELAGGRLRLDVHGTESFRTERVADRVEALGGTMSRDGERLTVEVPCE